MQHSVSLSVTTDNDEEWCGVVSSFSQFLKDKGGLYSAVTISSVNLDQDGAEEKSEDVWFDEYTLFKVWKAMEAAGVDTYQIKDAISQMQNAGILFRERAITNE